MVLIHFNNVKKPFPLIIVTITMGSSETFSLKWEDHLPNLSDTFRTLRGDNTLSDVTLVCDDHEVEAHRIVLSASSKFFQKMFSRKRNEKYFPLVYLKGVKKEQLLSVLDFIYLGIVSIEQEKLQSFCRMVRSLRAWFPSVSFSNKNLWAGTAQRTKFV